MIKYAVPANPVIQYTGANSAEILAALEARKPWPQVEVSLVSETCGALTIHFDFSVIGGPYPSFDLTFSIGDWCQLASAFSEGAGVTTAADFAESFIVKE